MDQVAVPLATVNLSSLCYWLMSATLFGLRWLWEQREANTAINSNVTSGRDLEWHHQVAGTMGLLQYLDKNFMAEVIFLPKYQTLSYCW